MALTKLPKAGLATGSVSSDQIEDGTIQNQEFEDGTLTSAKLADSTIANAKLSNSSFTLNGTAVSLGGSINPKATVDWQSVKTSDFTAVAGEGYIVNTSSAAVTVTLPASASLGDTIAIKDYAGTFATNNCTIGRNGHNIQGATNNSLLSTNRASVVLVYADATKGWLYTDEHNVADLQAPLFTSATGGTETTSGNFKIHKFTSTGCFAVSTLGNSPAVPTGGPSNVDYLVVAGGGGAGNNSAGGGAGGYRTSFPSPSCNAGSFPISATTYPITVGAGGSHPGTSTQNGDNGSNSIFSTITSAGGGGGGTGYDGSSSSNGNPGGSGGGGGNSEGPSTGGSGNTPPVSPSQGNNGGNGTSPTSGPRGNSGGGGASAVGGNGTAPTAGAGGAGYENAITGLGSTTSFTDSGPTGHVITRSGNTYHRQANSPFSPKFGNTAIYFDGSGDKLTIPDSSDFTFGTGDFTVEFFVYMGDQSDTYTTIVNDPGTNHFRVNFGSSSTAPKLTFYSSSWDAHTEGTTDLSDTTWHHCAIVRESGTLSIYVDGSRENTRASSTNSLDPGALTFGEYNGGTKSFTGYIEELRISNTARYTGTSYTVPTSVFTTDSNTKFLLQSESDIYYSGGGGGSGGGTPTSASGDAGIGGGGAGGPHNSATPAGVLGVANTGGGAGGGNPANASGGSGVVIIRYKYQ